MKKIAVVYGEVKTPIQKKALEQISSIVLGQTMEYPACVRYTDLKEKEFFLPMLTIQPIVENAVKHGIRKKAGKGNITISTYADADNNYIKISDDGVGFDVNSCEFTDGNHAGIKNVSDRIHLMTKGSLDIESTPDVGTTVVITIPKQVEKIKLR